VKPVDVAQRGPRGIRTIIAIILVWERAYFVFLHRNVDSPDYQCRIGIMLQSVVV